MPIRSLIQARDRIQMGLEKTVAGLRFTASRPGTANIQIDCPAHQHVYVAVNNCPIDQRRKPGRRIDNVKGNG